MKSLIKKILLCSALLAPILAYAEYDMDLTKQNIGKLHINQTAKALQVVNKCTFSKDKIELWDADALYHQTWKSNACGLTLDMYSDTPNDAQQVGSISIVAPSTLSTLNGIKIGSPKSAVLKAYKGKISEFSDTNTTIVGSVYGGIIIKYKNDKVVEIFVGAIAE
jgi:hypothetical protein